MRPSSPHLLQLPAINHYAHAAGVSGFALLHDLGEEEFWSVVLPKARQRWEGWRLQGPTC